MHSGMLRASILLEFYGVRAVFYPFQRGIKNAKRFLFYTSRRCLMVPLREFVGVSLFWQRCNLECP